MLFYHPIFPIGCSLDDGNVQYNHDVSVGDLLCLIFLGLSLDNGKRVFTQIVRFTHL